MYITAILRLRGISETSDLVEFKAYTSNKFETTMDLR